MPIAGQIKPLHETDPRDVIWEEVGSLDGIEPLFQNVLVATYIRAGKTVGGILLVDKVVDEDRYQGKVGMVLKLGPRAFVDDLDNRVFFHGFRVEPGDWVVFRPSEGLKMQVGKRDCRLVADVHIAKMRVSHPDAVY